MKDLLRLEAGKSKLAFSGTGPGEQTLDGCSVEFYRRSQTGEEPALIQEFGPPPADLLELGCGAGRVTGSLVDAGYSVTAVDNSEAMLNNITGASLVLSDIESLRLGRTFDVVTLASYLLNSPLPETRTAFLETVGAHLATDGVALFAVNPPAILESRVGILRDDDECTVGISEFEVDGSLISMTLTYRMGEQDWSHSFDTQYLPEDEIRELLDSHGLRFSTWMHERQSWFSATRS